MKILVVSSYLPFPLFSGGHVRLYNLLKELSKKHEITLVCEKRKQQTEKDIQEVKKICKEVFVIQRKKQWSADVILKTAISSLPFLLQGHNLPEMKAAIAKLLEKNTYDLIHVETFYVYQNVPETILPVVLAEHNIEYKVYQRFVDVSPFLLRPLMQIDVEKIKYWEKKYWDMAAKVVAVSQIEAQEISHDAVVVANGVDLASFPFKKIEKKKEQTVLFMGDFKWIQNTTTLEWILKDIWPKIAEKSDNVRLWIVGKNIPEDLKKYGSERILFDEHAPDKTSDIYKKADILLSPIKVGGGTSYKILEAMASGVPVITTYLGIEGLQAKNGKHALTAETASDLSENVLVILRDDKKYNEIRKNAREFIEERYSWTKIAKVLEGVYESVVKK